MSSPPDAATTLNSSCRHSSSICKQCQTDKPSGNKNVDENTGNEDVAAKCKSTPPLPFNLSSCLYHSWKRPNIANSTSPTVTGAENCIHQAGFPARLPQNCNNKVQSVIQQAKGNTAPKSSTTDQLACGDNTCIPHLKVDENRSNEAVATISKFTTSISSSSSLTDRHSSDCQNVSSSSTTVTGAEHHNDPTGSPYPPPQDRKNQVQSVTQEAEHNPVRTPSFTDKLACAFKTSVLRLKGDENSSNETVTAVSKFTPPVFSSFIDWNSSDFYNVSSSTSTNVTEAENPGDYIEKPDPPPQDSNNQVQCAIQQGKDTTVATPSTSDKLTCREKTCVPLLKVDGYCSNENVSAIGKYIPLLSSTSSPPECDPSKSPNVSSHSSTDSTKGEHDQTESQKSLQDAKKQVTVLQAKDLEDNSVPISSSNDKFAFVDKTYSSRLKEDGESWDEDDVTLVRKFTPPYPQIPCSKRPEYIPSYYSFDDEPIGWESRSSEPRSSESRSSESRNSESRPSIGRKSRRSVTRVFRHVDDQMMIAERVRTHPIEGPVCIRATGGVDKEEEILVLPGLWGTFVISLFAGGIAAAAGNIVTSPLRGVKRDLTLAEQVHRSAIIVRDHVDKTVERVVKKRVRVRDLVMPHTPNILRIIPYGGFLFASHEMWKKILHITPRSKRTHRMCAGSLAGVTAVTVTYPLDILRVRVAARVSEEYTTVRSGFRHIWNEGRSGMYRGFLPSVLGVIPFCGVKFFLYDNLKYRYFENTGERPGFLAYCYFGTLSGMIGQTVSFPMEVVRKRMQRTFAGNEKYSSILGTLITVFREEGFSGYFKNKKFHWVGPPLAVGLSFGMFEVLRDKFVGAWLYRHY